MFARARIWKDHLTTDGDTSPTRAGATFTLGSFEPGDDEAIFVGTEVRRFSLVDDDGITYYEGTLQGDDEGLAEMEEALYHWGAHDAGTTLLRVDGEDTIG